MGYRDNPGNAAIETYTALTALDRGFSRTVPVTEPFSERPALNRRATAVNNLSYLLGEAEKSREYARSYRDFRVGAAAFVLYWKDGIERQAYIHGANIKPTRSNEVNVHAEHILMRNIERYQQPGEQIDVPILAVVGDYQPDQQSGIETRTLHPCGICRTDFASFTEPSFDDTIFITAQPTLQTFEWFDLTTLDQLHNGKGGEPGYAQFDRPLSIFKPLEAEVGTPLRIPDVSNDEQAFDSLVRVPIMLGR